MAYLQQIAQRNNNTGNSISLLQPLKPFVTTGVDVFSEEEIMPPSPAPAPVTIVQPTQHTTVFNEIPKRVETEVQKESIYIRSQVERTLVMPAATATQPTMVIQNKPATETKEVTNVLSQPVSQTLISPVTVNKEQTVTKEIIPLAVKEQPLPAVKQLLPTAAREPLPKQVVTQNKLVIGKITVEIVQPVQPPVKTRERIITRVVTNAAGNSSQAGRNKLSFGLGQL